MTGTLPSSRLRSAGRILLGLVLLVAGVGHFAGTETFYAQVPDWVPLDKEVVVLASGVVELVLGVAVVLGRHRVLVGWVVAAFFVAVFPGNVSQYVTGTDAFGLDTDRARLVRLFFQPVLVIWALWCTGAWSAWRARRARTRQRRSSTSRAAR